MSSSAEFGCWVHGTIQRFSCYKDDHESDQKAKLIFGLLRSSVSKPTSARCRDIDLVSIRLGKKESTEIEPHARPACHMYATVAVLQGLLPSPIIAAFISSVNRSSFRDPSMPPSRHRIRDQRSKMNIRGIISQPPHQHSISS